MAKILLKLVADAGGAVALRGGALEEAGLRRVNDPRRGDCLVIRMASVEIGAIHLGDQVAARLQRGVIEVRTSLVEILGAWRA